MIKVKSEARKWKNIFLTNSSSYCLTLMLLHRESVKRTKTFHIPPKQQKFIFETDPLLIECDDQRVWHQKSLWKCVGEVLLLVQPGTKSSSWTSNNQMRVCCERPRELGAKCPYFFIAIVCLAADKKNRHLPNMLICSVPSIDKMNSSHSVSGKDLHGEFICGCPSKNSSHFIFTVCVCVEWW